MTDTLIVAPREIRDYAYRAIRLTGADHGVAHEIARAAVFAHIQLDSHLVNVVEALERGETPVFGMPYVVAAELNGGSELSDGVVVADLALFAWEACERHHQIHLTCGDGEERSPSEWLTVGRGELGVSSMRAVDAVPGEQVDAWVKRRSADASANGVSLVLFAWSTLRDLAAGYLVPEREIDASSTA